MIMELKNGGLLELFHYCIHAFWGKSEKRIKLFMLFFEFNCTCERCSFIFLFFLNMEDVRVVDGNDFDDWQVIMVG